MPRCPFLLYRFSILHRAFFIDFKAADKLPVGARPDALAEVQWSSIPPRPLAPLVSATYDFRRRADMSIRRGSIFRRHYFLEQAFRSRADAAIDMAQYAQLLNIAAKRKPPAPMRTNRRPPTPASLSAKISPN